jgi:hypothetical protein
LQENDVVGDIMLREVRQIQKDKYHMFLSYVGVEPKNRKKKRLTPISYHARES